jgi:hypothetical protein
MMTLFVDDRRPMEAVMELYAGAGESVVEAVRMKSPTVLQTLAEAGKRLREIFGEQIELRLSLKRDPEIRGLETVVAEIRTALAMKDALQRMDRFDEWWLGASRHEVAEVTFLLVPQ